MAYVSENHVSEGSEHKTIYTAPGRDVTRRDVMVEDKTTTGVLTGGASLEVIGGAGAVVLSIIALTGTLPLYLTAIATIAIGGALMAQGAAIAARWRDTTARLGGREEQVEIGSGIAAETLGGACGVVLGILALAHIYPAYLLPIAALVFGGSMLIGSPSQAELASLGTDRYDRVMREAVRASSGLMALVGIGAGVLGLLALIGVGPVFTLTMVAMLIFGGGLVLSGGTLAAKFGRRLAHQY